MTPEEITKQVHQIDELLKAGQYHQVVRQGELLLQFCPESVPLLRILGYAYLGLKNFPPATRHLETALRYDDNQARAFCSLAKVLICEKRYEQADLFFIKAFNTHKMDSIEGFEDWYSCERELKNRQAKFKGLANQLDFQPLRDPEGVLIKALQACKLNENFTFAWIERLVNQGTFNGFIEGKLRNYLEVFPYRKNAWNLLIKSLISKGIMDKAIRELDRYRQTVGHNTAWLDLLRHSAQIGWQSTGRQSV